MKIKKHGKNFNKEPDKKEKFECENCGCEFTAEEDEYYVDRGGADSNYSESWISIAYTISSVIKDYLVCSCPECHKIVKEIRERENTSYPYLNVNGSSVTSTGSQVTCKNNGTAERDSTTVCYDAADLSAAQKAIEKALKFK